MNARTEAFVLGKTTYEGGPCKRCGGTERYVCNGACCSCHGGKVRRKARDAQDLKLRSNAAKRGHSKYESIKPCNCSFCGGQETPMRYTKTGVCVKCSSIRNKTRNMLRSKKEASEMGCIFTVRRVENESSPGHCKTHGSFLSFGEFPYNVYRYANNGQCPLCQPERLQIEGAKQSNATTDMDVVNFLNLRLDDYRILVMGGGAQVMIRPVMPPARDPEWFNMMMDKREQWLRSLGY